MVKTGTIKWGKAESHAWHDLFLMGLAIKNGIFNPDHPLLILVDTSAVETAGFVMQWSPVTNQLGVLESKSHLSTTPKRRASPVHRESQGTHYVMEASRPYLLQTRCKQFPLCRCLLNILHKLRETIWELLIWIIMYSLKISITECYPRRNAFIFYILRFTTGLKCYLNFPKSTFVIISYPFFSS